MNYQLIFLRTNHWISKKIYSKSQFQKIVGTCKLKKSCFNHSHIWHAHCSHDKREHYRVLKCHEAVATEIQPFVLVWSAFFCIIFGQGNLWDCWVISCHIAHIDQLAFVLWRGLGFSIRSWLKRILHNWQVKREIS